MHYGLAKQAHEQSSQQSRCLQQNGASSGMFGGTTSSSGCLHPTGTPSPLTRSAGSTNNATNVCHTAGVQARGATVVTA